MNDLVPIPRQPEDNLPRQAETDEMLIALWLHGRSRHTQRAYRSDAKRFLAFVDKTLHQITLGDIQAFTDMLDAKGLAVASTNRSLAAVKSLIAFGHRIGYLPFDIGRPVRMAPVRDSLNERILSEAEVQRIIALETNPRNHAILTTLYGSAIRVAELCGLRRRDLTERPETESGQLTIYGKGGKTRVVLVPASVWQELIALRGTSEGDAPVFRSRRGGHLDPSQVWRIVRKAAKRAGIEKPVSPHGFRHSHCSHALARGCPIHIAQSQCGHSSISTTGKYLHARPTDSSSNYLPL